MATLVDLPIAALDAADAPADLARVAVIVPTCNAGSHWSAFSAALRSQAIPPGQVLLVDSASDDGTYELAQAEGFQVHRIERREFNHGGTRQMAVGMVPWADIVVYLTQDAVLATPDAIMQLLAAFEDPAVAAAYGRQLPRPGAGAIETHARLFNYPPQSDVRDYESRHTLGIKAAFMSNSFAAYRVERLVDIGGFPSNTIMAEDAIVAGKLLLAGWKIAYVAEAEVYHSHPFTLRQEFQRYFDTGVYHREEAWLRKRFGGPRGEGKRFVISELTFLAPRNLHIMPYALLRTVSKALGYKLGLLSAQLGPRWCRMISYHKGYWDNAAASS
ncbi:MAG TPA: glycosyltransferase [Acidobacteriaceae bacterium]